MKTKRIGSYHWMQATNGQLSFKEKIKLMQKIMLPSVMASIKINYFRFKPFSNFDIDQIVIPDTQMVKVALDELEAKADISIYNHSWRTYFWGAALGNIQKQQFDDESLLIASLFHDIGLTEQHIHSKGCNCFTYESAKQFELKAKEHSFDEKKSGVIKDAICLHMNGYIDHSDPAEITLLQQGASCDVISDGLYRLPVSFRNEILEKYPRKQFNKEFIELIDLESKNVPNSRTSLLNSLGLPLMIKSNLYKE
ncbi:HD domain-containing protein [Acinetobacter pittii]|uniref:HD domain-containing protein n=1 Tax=Acinetobacter pittii TaxID=48296 RepID=UPI0012985915|nr:HD domain-containing protein [Acinetobacter pittii]MCU4344487.1 HD domain-containing protein [Acinetobacter pittii]MCU4355324.1 HD domain-containing protein [Acinetobacter pittii]MRA46408.1 phosphohydrolase [Acinetobacter pittii]